MAKDLLTILKEVRGTGAPEAPYTDGIFHDIAIKDYNGNDGMYGDIVVKHGEVETAANITAVNATNALDSENKAKTSEDQSLIYKNLSRDYRDSALASATSTSVDKDLASASANEASASAIVSVSAKDIAVTKANEASTSATEAEASAVSALDSKNILLAKEEDMMNELDYALRTSLVHELHKCGCNV